MQRQCALCDGLCPLPPGVGKLPGVELRGEDFRSARSNAGLSGPTIELKTGKTHHPPVLLAVEGDVNVVRIDCGLANHGELVLAGAGHDTG